MGDGVHMSEDDLFRTSTQYRLWSYSPESLKSLRAATNELAAKRVLEAFLKARRSVEGQQATTDDVECLTPAEELKLVGYYCVQVMEFAEFLKLPISVKATAVQYLKRFYLSNSPMTYAPKQFTPTALFLACKTENVYMPLSKLSSQLPRTTPETIKAPEFTLVQGLRFSFDIRHPHLGLEGGFMELDAMKNGRYVPRAISPLSTQSIAEAIITVPPADPAKPWEPSRAGLKDRMVAAHQRATHLLKTSALLSDVYFLYTPAQIWLAAFLAADAPLAKFYLATILSGTTMPSSDLAGATSEPMDSILAALDGCRALLVARAAGTPDADELRELKKLEKKLGRCQNPAKADLSSLKGYGQVDKKRDSEEGAGTGEEGEGRKKKKRRVEDDDVFGGDLVGK